MSPHRVVIVAGSVAIVVGGILLVLWLSGNPELIRFAAWRGKANTSVGLVLSGVALLVCSSRRPVARNLGVVLASAAGVLGTVTLFQYIAGIDLGIDQWIAREGPFAEAAAYPNRMSPNVALSFVLLGACLLYTS